MKKTSHPLILQTSLGDRLNLPTPVVAASGTFGYGEEVADLADLRSLGALITPTLTLEPRQGHPMPRTVEAAAGLLHATGLPNPGISAFLTERLRRLRALPCPIIVSIQGETTGEWRQLGEALEGAEGLSALELNVSSVSLAGETEILRTIEKAVQAVREAVSLPLIVKLPSANVEIGAAAKTAEEAGADVIAVSQAFAGVAVRLSGRQFRLPSVQGELSGPCIKPLALYQVWRVSQSVKLPILGSGGIMTGDDALEFLMAGASAVAVGIASAIHPNAIAVITGEIASYLSRHHLASPAELTGVALQTGI